MKLIFKSILYTILCLVYAQSALAEKELNIYSARKEALIKPLLDKFATEQNIKINLVTGKADTLIERLRNEAENTPADLLITVDAGRLHRAEQADLFQPIQDTNITEQVPVQYRDLEGYWYGLSVRVRAIVYHKERVNPEELSSYEDLVDPKWNNRICVRSSNNIYNQSLVASMIAHHGVEATQAWADEFVKNLARKPQGGDRDQIKAIAAGQCDIALVNSYYYAKMLQGGNAEEIAAAEQVDIFWPNQEGYGAHVNISGVGVIKHSQNPDLARELIKFLLSTNAQEWYGNANLEYPVRSNIATNTLLEKWGPYKADTLNLEELGKLNAQAVLLMDRAKWR